MTTSLEAGELAVRMIKASEWAVSNWAGLKDRSTPSRLPSPESRSTRQATRNTGTGIGTPRYAIDPPGGMSSFIEQPPNAERGCGRVVLKMSICIVVEVPNAPMVLE